MAAGVQKTGSPAWALQEDSVTSMIVCDRTCSTPTTKVMGQACDCGLWRPWETAARRALVKELIAKRIIEAVENGERDPQRLLAEALDALGLNGHRS